MEKGKSVCRDNTVFLKVSVFTVVLLISFACGKPSHDSHTENAKSEPPEEEVIAFDLGEIKSRGVLKVIIENSATSYFIYKGQPMGYDYELLQRYADHEKLHLQFVVTKDLDEGFRKLNAGEGDILAYNLTVTNERRKRISFTDYHNLARQVLVQRKPEGWRQMKRHEIEAQVIRNPIDLIGKEIVVRNGSSYISRLENLSDEIGGEIIIVPAFSNLSTENLIQQVAKGEINYTVAEENVALLSATYFSILDVKTALSLPQQIAWGIRKNAPQLLQSLNDWIAQMRSSPDYNLIYAKYFEDTKVFSQLTRSNYFGVKGGEISPYDDSIKALAIEIGWDWKLLAAMIFVESRFDPRAKSWAGAVGLMQLVPETGRMFGLAPHDLMHPQKNMKAGVKYLKWLDELWKDRIPEKEERIKFVLASYNVGQGHVIDAVKLTEKYHGDPHKWEDVARLLLKKSEPNYFNDPAVEFGYCRGEEPVNYVAEILLLYDQYIQVLTI